MELRSWEVRTRVVLGATLLLLAGPSAPGCAEQDPPGAGGSWGVLSQLQPEDLIEPLSDDQRARIAGLIYSRFVEVLSNSGFDVTISTQDFVTIPQSAFADYPAARAQTYNSPRRLVVGQEVRSLNGRLQGVSYVPEWEEGPFIQWTKEDESVSLQEAFEESAAFLGSFECPFAVTSFDIALAFDGQELKYRAMVSWMKPNSLGFAKFRAEDVNIIHLNEATADGRPIAPRAELKARTRQLHFAPAPNQSTTAPPERPPQR